MLPAIKAMTPERNNFSTRWQTVIFRNYRMVPSRTIAQVLGCTEADVEREARRMGLRPGPCDPDWLSRGHITLIRNNWYLLPYEQLMTLIGFSRERLDFVLAKDDFLWVKLGRTKPDCLPVAYCPLTPEQEAETAEIAKIVSGWDISGRKMFDFYRDPADTKPGVTTSPDGGLRMVHPYLTPCADPFLEDTRTHLPDALLDDYARVGVNAFVIHATLSTISPDPFDPEQSRDYPLRRRNLQDLICRAGKRGIRIYLYLNEPRAVPRDVFDRYGKPELGGRTTDEGLVSLCLEVEENRAYLYNAVHDLFAALPGIGGVVSTTMSENKTHCLSSKKTNCPRCGALPMETMPVRVNNIIHQAIRDAGSGADVIATLWGWTDEQIGCGIPKLHPDICVWSVSEWGMPTNKGGVPYHVVDYSISNPGPSEMTCRAFAAALACRHRVCAKVQVSNSWELSAVPYLPVFDLELEHLQNLHAIGTRDYQLTWTLGSYPSLTFDMISAYLAAPETFSLPQWYETHFGAAAQTVHAAVKHFCRGFREYPFSCEVIYRSAKNMGVANRWSLTKNENQSTMVCWTFDDVEYFTYPYPSDVFVGQMEKLLEAWDEGCALLETVAHSSAAATELTLFAKVARNHIRADVVHTKYALCKRRLPDSAGEMREIFAQERALVEELLQLLPQSTLIGYETANHYFYTERDLMEKLVQLRGMEQELNEMEGEQK